MADPGGVLRWLAAPRVSKIPLPSSLNRGTAPWIPVQNPGVNQSWIRPCKCQALWLDLFDQSLPNTRAFDMLARIIKFVKVSNKLPLFYHWSEIGQLLWFAHLEGRWWFIPAKKLRKLYFMKSAFSFIPLKTMAKASFSLTIGGIYFTNHAS